MSPAPQSLSIATVDQVAQARRAATDLARDAGMPEEAVARIALVTTEAATNLAKYSQQGRLFLRMASELSSPAVDILAVDSGPGINDLKASVKDGFSTGGSMGGGFGALRRLSQIFELQSVPGKGTVVFCRVGLASAAAPDVALPAGAVCTSAPGEKVSGDAFDILSGEGRVLMVVADGLGHGPDANIASELACATVREQQDRSPGDLIERIHAALRPTRGAAVAITALDLGAGSIRYAGVGNISSSIVGSGPARHMVSHNGTAGHEVRRVQEFEYKLPRGAFVVMHSDGVSARWNLDAYGAYGKFHPAIVAALLHRDHCRGRDDATVAALHYTA